MDSSEKKKVREIDIITSVKRVLKEKGLLLKFILCFMTLGVVVALNTAKKYTTSVILAPEVSSNGLGVSETIKDMASSFGLNFGGNTSSFDAIYPEIYPEVFASADFIMTLFDVRVKTKEDSIKTYYAHLKDDTHIPFWRYPISWVSLLLKSKKTVTVSNSNEGPFGLSEEEESICGQIGNSINCLIDRKTSVITISVTDEDPIVSAIIADTVQQRLTDYIIAYRTKKARNDYDFALKLYTESKNEYLKAQNRYVSFADANKNPAFQSIVTKEQELENDMMLKYNIYSQMATQLQSAKAKIQERTPAFSVIQKAIIPLRASSMPRSYIVLLFIFIGIACDALWVLYIRTLFKRK